MTKEQAAELVLQGPPKTGLTRMNIVLADYPNKMEMRSCKILIAEWDRYLEAKRVLGIPRPPVDYEEFEVRMASVLLIKAKDQPQHRNNRVYRL